MRCLFYVHSKFRSSPLFSEVDLSFAELRCEINDEDTDELDPGTDRWMMMILIIL